MEPQEGQEVKGLRGGLYFEAGIKLVLFVVVLGLILFVSAGRLDWIMGWVLIATFLGCVIINIIVLMLVNPEVVEERMHSKGKWEGWDKVIGVFLGVLWLLALIWAGLDERFGWSPEVGLRIRIAAIVVMVAGDLIFLWAMAVNKFFSKLVRIQSERGHRVITSGPYQYVRHPGYVGWTLMSLPIPVILGSLWALIAVILSVVVMIVRTAFEDRTLRDGLEGYREYAERVRYRLLPWIW